ncbi:hypothetical protein GX645_05510 [Candidatus Sumerlaeota bacterium]|nr:hypothetical protein [Candidatus Sumerlaeota bacterium]
MKKTLLHLLQMIAKLNSYQWLWPTICFVTVLGVALAIRIRAFLLTLGHTFDPDAIGYWSIAQRCSYFATEKREPLYIWMVKFVQLFPLSQDVAMRSLSVLAGMICTVLIIYASWRWFGLLAAWIAGITYALSPAMVFTAVRGLREEWIIALFLWIAIEYVATWGKPYSWRTALRLGIPLGLSCLLRLFTCIYVPIILVVHIAWALYRNRQPAKQWMPAVGLVFLISWIPLSPYLIYSHKEYGNMFYVSQLGARFYANLEFAGKLPGFPSVEEVRQNGYAGKPITMTEYIFKYHTLPEVLNRFYQGIITMGLYGGYTTWCHYPVWTRYHEEIKSVWAQSSPKFREEMFTPVQQRLTFVLWRYLATIGFLALLFYKQGRLLTFLILAFHIQIYFLIPLPGFDWRLATSFFPYINIGWGAAAALFLLGLKKLNESDSKKETLKS